MITVDIDNETAIALRNLIIDTIDVFQENEEVFGDLLKELNNELDEHGEDEKMRDRIDEYVKANDLFKYFNEDTREQYPELNVQGAWELVEKYFKDVGFEENDIVFAMECLYC
jgi:predicted translin family RNA/ssDNA-binding protein